MEFSENVTVLEYEGKTIYLIGTAHVSAESKREVEEVIEAIRPDTVCVELCQSRYEALTDEDRWKKLDVFKVIREGKMLLLLANLALGAYQRRLGAKLGIEPGAELLAGARKAEEVGAHLELVDRDIRLTLRRTWSNIGFWKKMALLGALTEGVFTRGDGDEIGEETIEDLKGRENLSQMLSEFAEAFPEVKEPLIDERDQFMISRIRESPGETIVAVVGAAHVPGMVDNLNVEVDRGPISVDPPPSKVTTAIKWAIPLAVVLLFWRGISSHRGDSAEDLLYAWILPNSIFAALLTLIAGGKPLSILAAFVGSPVTSLNPLINTGMVVGLVEAWRRKPTVEDCERINDDIQTWKGFYKNSFTRVLLVAVFSMFGSAIGAWVGLSWLLKLVAT